MAVKAKAEKVDESISLLYEIGESAGKVYQYLAAKQGGAESLPQIAKGTNLESTISAMAIGWLSRENVVIVERSAKKTQIRLNKR